MSHLIVIAILLLSSGAMSAMRWYAKKKAEIDAERAEREREQAILRTGRDPRDPTAGLAGVSRPQQPPRPREEDLMAERQETLRQLRRQQAGEADESRAQPFPRNPPQMGGGGGGGGGPITRELWPGGPVIVINSSGGDAPTAPAPRPVQRTQQELRRPPQPVQQQRQPMAQQRPQQKKAKPVQKRQQPQPQQRQPVAPQRSESRHDEAYYQRERTLARMQASSRAEEAPVAAPPVFVRPTTAQQWRAAFIAAEVFGTPVSMRDPSAPIGNPIR